MNGRNIFIIFLAVLLSLITTSCEDDNKGFEEYYHPMGNNPVQVVPWLIRLKKSFYGKEARISLYKLNEKEYYTVEVLVESNGISTKPYTIYEKNDEEDIIYFHTDDAYASEQDEVFTYFIKNAERINVLWSNEGKNSSFDL